MTIIPFHSNTTRHATTRHPTCLDEKGKHDTTRHGKTRHDIPRHNKTLRAIMHEEDKTTATQDHTQHNTTTRQSTRQPHNHKTTQPQPQPNPRLGGHSKREKRVTISTWSILFDFGTSSLVLGLTFNVSWGQGQALELGGGICGSWGCRVRGPGSGSRED